MSSQFDTITPSYVRQEELVILPDVSFAHLTAVKHHSTFVYILINTRGRVRTRYDESELMIENRSVVCLLNGHTLQVQDCSEDNSCTVIILSDAFWEELRKNSFSHNYTQFHLSPVCSLTEEQLEKAKLFADNIRMVSRLTSSQTSSRHEMLLALGAIGFELLHIVRSKDGEGVVSSGRNFAIFNQFSELLAVHYRTSREVKFYANLLFLSPKYFSNTIRAHTGQSASKWIEEYVTAQAKRVLRTRTDITIQEAGFLLGFSEPASFVHYFKRATGMTPKEYRNSTRG